MGGTVNEGDGSSSGGFRVDVIPAKKALAQRGKQLKNQKNMRVAAYCRVSTGDESQQTSYTKQKFFYTELIRKMPGWKMAGIYAEM